MPGVQAGDLKAGGAAGQDLGGSQALVRVCEQGGEAGPLPGRVGCHSRLGVGWFGVGWLRRVGRLGGGWCGGLVRVVVGVVPAELLAEG